MARADDDGVVLRHGVLRELYSAERLSLRRSHSALRHRYIRPHAGTPFHARTFALCESLSYRDWAGYYAASSYEPLHEHEYNAIRNAAALIDVSPLFKYILRGNDAVRLVDRVITRDVTKMAAAR